MRTFLRLLLGLYPPAFRREYGREWMDTAVERLGRLRAQGHPWPTLAFARFLLGDLPRSCPGLWLDTLSRNPVPGRRPTARRPAMKATTMDMLLQDLRFGFRTLLKRPLFALLAMGTLGLGIGATTAIFSVVEGVLLTPPPYEGPSELVSVYKTRPAWRNIPALAPYWDLGLQSYPGYQRWRGGQTRFTDVAIHGSTARNLTGEGEPERLTVGIASSSLLPVLGVQPILGRGFTPEEDRADAPPVALLSHAFWKERFGGEASVLGRSVQLDQVPFTVVGVLPPGFRLQDPSTTRRSEALPIWIPVGADGNPRSEGSHSYWALGRLAPGSTIHQARAEALQLIPTPGDEDDVGVRMDPMMTLERAGFRSPLLLLLAASGILLLIACGNVATLLLGEAHGRTHEMATRAALGAGRRRLVRQLLTESILLGLGGALVGAGIAFTGTRLLLAQAPAMPRLDQVAISPLVLVFATLLGIGTGILFGMAPAVSLGWGPSLQSLTGGWRSSPRGRWAFQRTIVAGELGLAMVLLVSGTLMARSLGQLMAVDPGFQGEHLAMVRTILPRYRYIEPQDLATQAEGMRQALAAVPGVTAASATSRLPFHDLPNLISFGIEGRPQPEGTSPHTSSRAVLSGFFETMGIRILQGRPILETDREGSRPVAVISESMAQRYWPGESPLGARILFWDTLEVVGVAADVIHESLDAQARETLYLSYPLEPTPRVSFVVRTAGPPEALFGALRQAIWSVDPDLPVTRTASLTSLMEESARPERFRTLLMALYSLCATALVAAGVFGVTARAVAQRKKELGIRRALGADSGLLLRLGLTGTFTSGLAGLGGGLLGAFFVSRLLQSFLFGVQPWDPVAYLLSTAGLLAIAGLAAWFPARKAARVEPMEVLREE